MELLKTWPYGVMVITLLVAVVTDLRTGKIYNWLTYPVVAVGLIGHTLVGGLGGSDYSIGLAGSLAGLAVGFAPMLLAWMAGGIGGGDAKLMAAVGALAGWTFALSAMFFGFAVAALMALAVMIRHKLVKQTMGRIWRFISLVIVRGRPADPAAPESRKIAFGIALCVGSAIALVELILSNKLIIEY